MYVRVLDIRDGMLAGSYVCKDVSQSGINGLENNILCVIDARYSSVHGLSNNQSQYLVAAALPNTATSAGVRCGY